MPHHQDYFEKSLFRRLGVDSTFAMPRGEYESGLALLGYTTLEGFNMNQAD
jgi:hypothetical protein